PGGYHLTNTLLHILNSLILLLLFYKMTGFLWRSFFIAAMFALHPLHVESVAWTTERKDVLMEIQKDISYEKNASFLGKILKVLVEGVEGDFYIGRSYRDAPEVDGEVLINKKGIKLQPGNFYDIKITDHDEYDLFGELIN
ncbi:MAG: hypothetical protein R6W68_09705, partial [Ignavibacteriaceae bacterium]